MTLTKREEINNEQAASNGNNPNIPGWVTEDYFGDILKEHVPRFKKIFKFEIATTGGSGENFASIMQRIKIKVILEDDSVQDVAYMLKILPSNERAKEMIDSCGMFPRELAMYEKYIPEFERIFLDAGKQVTFGPKSYRFKKNPGVEYILLEDISPKGFKNANRLEGLDLEHAESVLRLLAAFHAASLMRHATKGEYETILTTNVFDNGQRETLDGMMQSFNRIFNDALQTYKIDSKYIEKIRKAQESTTDKLVEISDVDPNGFNVVLHGDLWANNIMFQYNKEGQREDTIFLDFQLSRVGSPVLDLFYFLISSTKFDINLINLYYYDNFIENMQLLKYPKSIPTYKQLRIDLLRKSFWLYWTITGVTPIALMDPNKEANADIFLEDGQAQRDFKYRMYTNPRFVKQIEVLLPWMDYRGFLS